MNCKTSDPAPLQSPACHPRWWPLLVVLASLVIAGCTSPDWLWRQNEEGPLWVRKAGGEWVAVGGIERGDLTGAREVVCADHRLSFSRLHLRRQNPFRINVFEFKPDAFHFQSVFLPEFALTTHDEMGRVQPGLLFIINANYFDENLAPLGWVVHEGKTFNREASRLDGYFLVTDDGQPLVGSPQQRANVRGEIREAVQSYPSLLDEYRIQLDVLRGEARLAHAAERTWRALIGQLADGTLVFLVSDTGCTVDLRELAQMARGLNIRNAMALDGGGSVQYRFRYGETEYSFSVRGREVPVFIGVREKSD